MTVPQPPKSTQWRWSAGLGVEKRQHEEAAVRETIEETGVQNLEVRHFITKTYHIFQRNGKFKLKITYWYEMYSDYQGPLIPQAAEGIKKAKWKNFEQSQKALQDSYENIKIIFPKEYLITHPNDRIPKV